MKVVIIGGVAGGASTATRLRRIDESVDITILERGKEISYANCGIPYYIGDVIKDRDNLLVISQEEFEKQFKVNVKTKSEVLKINREAKTVTVKDHVNNNVYEEAYDKLVLSPGAQPIKPNIPGINDSRIFTIRTLDDMDCMKSFLNNEKPKKGIVIGGGFIGLEIAENLKHLGLQVSLVEKSNQVMNILDYEMAVAVHQHLKSKNIELFLGDGVLAFEHVKNGLNVKLESGRSIAGDFVVFSIGVKPEKKLAEECGLEIGELGGVKVSNKMETSDPNIYALGDVIELEDIITGKPTLIPLANSANKQGRIVADNIKGLNQTYKGTPGVSIAKVFDLAVAFVGNNEKQLKRNNIDYDTVYLTPSSHAGYYPGAFPLLLKLLYDKNSGSILGGQIVGSEGADKRIDVLSVMIQNKKTVFDLAEIELAYAPPFSSAKDPVNLAGMIAVNKIKGLNKTVNWDEFEKLKEEGVVFLDVRTALEYKLGHIENALNIPFFEIRDRIKEIPKDKKVVIYCYQGKTSYFAFSILRNLGFTNIYNLNGGYKIHKTVNLPQENIGLFDNESIDKRDDLQNVDLKEGEIHEIDASGLQCPGPIMRTAKAIEARKTGDVVSVTATDPGFKNDIAVWCEKTNNSLLSLDEEDKKIIVKIQKGAKKEADSLIGTIPHGKTIVMFSNDFDKAIASLIIANGARSLGREVTIFFTFWGLNLLRKSKRVKVKKNIIEKMFAFMMPRGTKKLSLSKMNMLGMGTLMMRKIMKKKNIDSLEELMQSAVDTGIRLVACQMSMDVMGIKQEELIEGVELGGVAMYLGAAEDADTNLFI